MIDYKKELENAAKTVILVHNPHTLTRMIVRTMVRKVNLNHAAILIRQNDTDNYVLTVSRGETGLKIPAGFARIDSANPLIKIFANRKSKELFSTEAITLTELSEKISEGKLDKRTETLFEKIRYQMDIFECEAAIPSYYQNSLLGILLLGNKKNASCFSREEIDFISALASDIAMALRNAFLFEELQEELEKKHKLFIHTTVALAAAIDAKDHYTHGHTSRVTGLSLTIAEEYFAIKHRIITREFRENLHIASLLHDIGKIGVPEAILNKQSSLTAEERKKIEEHPLIGVTILQPIKELHDALEGIKYHHEKYDGSGYPEGRKKDDIPLIASIISVADSYDAMTTDRPYRKALSKEKAAAELNAQSGKQFDPAVIKSFMSACKKNRI